MPPYGRYTCLSERKRWSVAYSNRVPFQSETISLCTLFDPERISTFRSYPTDTSPLCGLCRVSNPAGRPLCAVRRQSSVSNRALHVQTLVCMESGLILSPTSPVIAKLRAYTITLSPIAGRLKHEGQSPHFAVGIFRLRY